MAQSEAGYSLFEAALAVRERAWAPYSGFRVGAAILGADGQIYAGCNVENASYPESQCAEATALGTMVASGCREVRAVLVLAEGAETIAPCGGCRQRLAEFAGVDVPVAMAGPEGIRTTQTLGELLPGAFGRRNLRQP